MSLEEQNLNDVKETCNYGTDDNYKRYDMKDILKDKLLDYRIKKIKCQIKPNSSIYGIQFIYRNILNCEEKDIINVKPKESDLLEQEMDLNNEDIIDLRVWLKDVKLIGFEITTSKNRVKKFGYGEEAELIKISDLENHDQIIVGFGCCENEQHEISSIYGYFISKRKYISVIFEGILWLRIKNKDPKFKQKVEEKVKKMNEKNQILYRVCNLPDNKFFNVIKYSSD